MMKKQKSVEDSIRQDKRKLIALSVIEVLLFFVEIFLIITPLSIIYTIICGVVALLVLIPLIGSGLDLSQNNKLLERKTYEDLYKAQKASYLVIRKSFDELQERMDRLEDKSSIPTDEIISAQKAVAKVTINRSKENADALLNSNDELINKLFSFEEKLDENNKQLLQHQREIMEQAKDDLVAKNQELEKQVEELTASIELLQQKAIEAASTGIEKTVKETPAETATQDAAEGEAESEDYSSLEETQDASLDAQETAQDTVVHMSDPDRVMSPEEIEALFANL